MLNSYENRPALAANLKEKAARYRWLADILFDPKIVAVVQACARDLDCEARFLEQLEERLKSPGARRPNALCPT